MMFNETKFEHLQYRVHQALLQDHQYYTEDGKSIKKVTELKDLGPWYHYEWCGIVLL